MGMSVLNTIEITSLSRISTPNGDVLHALKNDDKEFFGFGEAYFSWINIDTVKAWKKHNAMSMNLIVPYGNVRFVFYDESTNNYRVEEIGDKRYARLSVPSGIWFGFKGLFSPSSLILNIANIKHEAYEVQKLAQTNFNYDWSLG
jgi:dTDP-4-dehydrorhamnose 3,5-epimerase